MRIKNWMDCTQKLYQTKSLVNDWCGLFNGKIVENNALFSHLEISYTTCDRTTYINLLLKSKPMFFVDGDGSCHNELMRKLMFSLGQVNGEYY